MLTPLLLAALLLATPADDAPPPEARAREAIERSLVYLQEESIDWIRDRQCATCHHAPMMIWAAYEAKARGFAVDQGAIDEASRFVLDDPVKSKVLTPPKPPGEAPTPAPGDLACLPSVYAALAAQAVPAEALSPAARESWKTIEANILEKQQADGSWVHGGGRPPMLESQEIATLMGLLALSGPASSGPGEPLAAGRKKAAEWIEKTPAGESRQSRVLRLLVAVRSGSGPEELAPAIDAILKAQNPDGGWGQTPEMPSDAYATGQALYTLSLAGLRPDRPEAGRARAFLVASQADDGSWPMTSRPTAPGGGPAKDLRPITAAATAWATLGLVRSSPR
jgi:hypothetical protein